MMIAPTDVPPSTQYHTLRILLHREFASADYANPPIDREVHPEQLYHFTIMSRKSCLESAIEIAQIFHRYRIKFNLKQAFSAALQHMGTASTALIVEIGASKRHQTLSSLHQHLVTLGECMSILSETYPWATVMLSVVEHFVKDMGGRPLVAKPAPTTSTSNHAASATQRATPSGLVPLADADGMLDDLRHKEQPFTPEYGEIMKIEHWNKTPEPNDVLQQEHQQQQHHHHLHQHQHQHHHHDTGELLDAWSGFPILPSSWFQENWDDDGGFLNSMGARTGGVTTATYLGGAHDHVDLFVPHNGT
jgi:hypothetical protein